jgi:hypothetical protein
MAIRTQLAALLTQITDEIGEPLSQIAKGLGYSRQRLHQLRIGDKSAAPEAIEEAINKLGYAVYVQAEKVEIQKQS